MPQSQQDGAEANRFDRECGGEIIKALGGNRVGSGSNECIVDGERISVHCARKRTTSVGVTKPTLQKVDAVFGAFQQEDGSFRVLRLSSDLYEQHSRPSGSAGNANRILVVGKAVFEENGRLVAIIPAF
jgi:hypothetical protein